MTTVVSTLHPPSDPRPVALALKLNPDILQQLRTLHKSHGKAKLVVKDGKFLFKVSETLVFPCSVSPETLRLDVYTPSGPSKDATLNYNFTGTVASRLNVLSDPKQIKEHKRTTLSTGTPSVHLQTGTSSRASLLSEASKATPSKATPSSVDLKAYVMHESDSDADRAYKFISFLALGPMTRPFVEDKLHLTKVLRNSDINLLFSNHTQPFLRKDTFTDGDVYPLLSRSQQARITPQENHLILKDKAYKELRPWQWDAYTEYERQLILENCNKALSRLGFLETHPLRLRIVERSSPQRTVKKPASLGGGLLVSSTKKTTSSTNLADVALSTLGSPLRSTSNSRATTELPDLSADSRKKFSERGKKAIGSPLRQEESLAQGHYASLVLSLSSDEEKFTKKTASTRVNRHSNTSVNSNSSVNSNTNSYTLPSSVNEDVHLDQSDHDSKQGNSLKPSAAASLPNRPSSSFTNHEKKHQYYLQLAEKFRLRYKEYEQLHRQLSKDTRKNSNTEKKKSLMKLFELHNTLSEWKRRLWDYHNENSMAEGVMNLSKHRKLNSQTKISALAPLTTKLSSTEKFHSLNGSLATRKQIVPDRPIVNRANPVLDY